MIRKIRIIGPGYLISPHLSCASLPFTYIVLASSNFSLSNTIYVPQKRKLTILLVVLNTVFNASISSALPSGAIGPISRAFDVYNEEQLFVPISAYLVGYCFGPLFWGPLSETFGRKTVMVGDPSESSPDLARPRRLLITTNKDRQ